MNQPIQAPWSSWISRFKAAKHMLSSFFSKLREPISGLTHFFAALAALAGLVILLVVGWGQIGKTISLAVYGASLVLLFAASASYHLVKARPGVVQALRKFDHSAIYLLIAGMADGFLKPMLLGRGVDAPMPVILIGALGGMVSFGLIGLFIGAVLLALAYVIFMEWVGHDESPDEKPEGDTASDSTSISPGA